MTFGTYIRTKRKKMGLTLDDCSNDLEVSPSFLAAVERGAKKAPAWMVYDVVQLLKLPEKKTVKLWLEDGPTISFPKITRKNGALEKTYTVLTDAVVALTRGIPRPN